MDSINIHNINKLVGDFIYLQEQWEDNPSAFPWDELEALAKAGALAYNEGSGPSFHILALDGLEHGEFHEKFLAFSLLAGFDPFKIVHMGADARPATVINHDGLAECSECNEYSARMRTMLVEAARRRFGPGVVTQFKTPAENAAAMILCSASIPPDLRR
ncbi:MAG TPA: hypothetical protein VGN04_03790 [Herbaspirillum sp.]|jgi:hypothetical protein